MSASCHCQQPELIGDGEAQHCEKCGCWSEEACRLANQRRAAAGFSMTDAQLERAPASHAAFMNRQIERGRELRVAEERAREILDAISSSRIAKANAKRVRKASKRSSATPETGRPWGT